MHSVYTFYLLQLPITSYNLPITGYLLPITSYQLPVTSYQLQAFLTRGLSFSFLSFLDHAAMHVVKAKTYGLLIGGVNTEWVKQNFSMTSSCGVRA